MRKGRIHFALLMLLAMMPLALTAACAHPAGEGPAPASQSPVSPSPAPGGKSPGAQTPEAGSPAATPAEQVAALLREAAAQPATGGRVSALASLESARGYAGHDAGLLAQVARAMSPWDWQRSEVIAREAVAADPKSAAAQVALGDILVHLDKEAEARPVLEQAYEGSGHGAEAGYLLALSLETLQETDRAKTILTDLTARFPDQSAPKQALARLNRLRAKWPAPGTPGSAVAGWSKEHFWYTADLLIGIDSDGQTLAALGPDGTGRWQFACGGKVLTLAFDETQARALLFTDKHTCLIDVATGALLGTGPQVEIDPFLLEGWAWRGDYVAFGTPVTIEGAPSVGYYGTDWQVYRLAKGADGKIVFAPLYRAADGSRRAELSQDGRTLFSYFGNHGAGRPRLFRDGRLVTDYPKLPTGAEFALDPRDDRFYLVTYGGFLQAYRLDGELLWQANAAGAVVPRLWKDATGKVAIAVPNGEQTAVYDDRGSLLWSAPGWPGLVNARYLTAGANGDPVLYDRKGKVVASLRRGTALTRDGKAMVRVVPGWIDVYGLP